MEGLLSSDKGKEVSNHYVEVAQAMDDFETKLFNQWCTDVIDVSNTKLKEFILKRAPKPNAPKVDRNTDDKRSSLERLLFDLNHTKIVVNFSPQLLVLIRETKYLDRMGFDIPPEAMNVALQEDKYYESVERLNAMLDTYEEVIGMVDDVEKEVLCQRIDDLHQIMSPGFNPINWNALCIADYIEACVRGIQDFQSVVNRMQKNSVMIESHISTIRTAELVRVDDFKYLPEVLRLEEFSAKIEKTRAEVAEHLVKKYRSIAPMLFKIEE
eukprot:45634_1